MVESASVVPYASTSADNPIWKLFRLGLLLWAALTLLRHGFYWAGTFYSGGSYAGLSLIFGGVECLLLVMILIAAINSPRPTRERFQLLGGFGTAFIAVVVVGAVIDIASSAPTFSPNSLLRVGWLFLARVQVLVFPLLCFIGLLRGIRED